MIKTVDKKWVDRCLIFNLFLLGITLNFLSSTPSILKYPNTNSYMNNKETWGRVTPGQHLILPITDNNHNRGNHIYRKFWKLLKGLNAFYMRFPKLISERFGLGILVFRPMKRPYYEAKDLYSRCNTLATKRFKRILQMGWRETKC